MLQTLGMMVAIVLCAICLLIFILGVTDLFK